MARSAPRTRKRAKPSFEVPPDVTSAPQSGWVFRSDAPAPATPAPTAPAPPKPSASAAARKKTAAPAPAPTPVPVEQPVMASSATPAASRSAPPRVSLADGPLRFAWLPLAIAYSTIIAMVPSLRSPR